MAALKTDIKVEENEDEVILNDDDDLERDNNVTDANKKKKKKKKKKKAGMSTKNFLEKILNLFWRGTWNFFYETIFIENGTTEKEQIEENKDAENENDAKENAENVDGEKKKKKRNRKKGSKPTQTDPPSIPIVELFSDQVFPLGEIMDYPLDDRTAKDRFTSEEKRALDRLHNDIYNEVRLAAEAHRQVICYLFKEDFY